MPLDPAARCPCLSGETYGGCCAPFHRGDATAPTAERLMRSRYSAFVIGDAPYLLRTWHPRTRPTTLELDSTVQWRRLDIVASTRGGLLDTEGTVEFQAFYRVNATPGVQHELSRFVRENRAWFYVEGDVLEDQGFFTVR